MDSHAGLPAALTEGATLLARRGKRSTWSVHAGILSITARDGEHGHPGSEGVIADAYRAAGIATPRLLEHGEHRGHAWGLWERVEGTALADHPDRAGTHLVDAYTQLHRALGAVDVGCTLVPAPAAQWSARSGLVAGVDVLASRGAVPTPAFWSGLAACEWRWAHNDLHPANVIVTTDIDGGAGPGLVLIDFELYGPIPAPASPERVEALYTHALAIGTTSTPPPGTPAIPDGTCPDPDVAALAGRLIARLAGLRANRPEQLDRVTATTINWLRAHGAATRTH